MWVCWWDDILRDVGTMRRGHAILQHSMTRLYTEGETYYVIAGIIAACILTINFYLINLSVVSLPVKALDR